MSAPSFLYSGIDKETLSLSDELNSMGGGDAQASHLEMHAVVNSNLLKNDSQLIWPYDNMIGLRDVSLPVGSPVSKSMKYFQMDSVTTHNGFPAEKQEFVNIALDASHWVTEGFNSCIISMGMRGTGKTTAMFGSFGLPQEERGIPSCLAGTVLESLFERKNSALNRRENVTTIAISAWSVVQDRITDLIAPVATHREPLDFASVECPDLSTACRILHEARTRAPGCLAYGNAGDATHESHRGHFFLRILLHQRSLQEHSPLSNTEGSISYMYLVDLLGLATTDNAQFNRLSEQERIATRANNLQLQCLVKVLSEMRSLSAAAATNPLSPAEAALTGLHAQSTHKGVKHGPNASIMKMTSARDSKLTTILAPIIQGNVKSSLLLFLQDGASCATETQHLLGSLNGVTEIMSACLRIKGISLRSLGLVQPDSILSPFHDPTRHPHSAAQPQPQAPMFVPAPYSPERDHRHRATGEAVYMPSPDLPYTFSPARGGGGAGGSGSSGSDGVHMAHSHMSRQHSFQQHFSQQQPPPHASSHTAQFSHTPLGGGGASVLTDTSTDYGEMDFDAILAGDFHSSLSSMKNQRTQGARHSPTRPTQTVSPHASPSRAHHAQSQHTQGQLGHQAMHPHAHPHYQQADLQRVAHPPSLEFVDHRRAFNHSEAHPSSFAGAHHAAVLTGAEAGAGEGHHLHIREEDIRRVEHTPSEEFLQRRKSHYLHEAHPGFQESEHHAHIREADARRAEHPPSQVFLDHRRAFNHSELHPTGHTADGHFAEEHHPHFQSQDMRGVNRAPSQEFAEHRRAFNHSELHPTSVTADGHYVEEHHPHFAGQDVRKHPPSEDFLSHRKSHYHSEAHPGSAGPPQGHGQNQNQNQSLNQNQSVFDNESPVRGPRTHPSVVQALDEFHDLMEELENAHHAEITQEQARERRGKNRGDQKMYAEQESMDARDVSFPRQIVRDFLQNSRRQSGDRSGDGRGSTPPRASSSTSAGPRTPPSAARSSRSPSPSPQRRSPDRRQDPHQDRPHSRSPGRENVHKEHKDKKRSPKKHKAHSDESSSSTIGPGQATYGADDSFFSHFQFPVELSPKQKGSRSERKASARKGGKGGKASGVDSSMMADSLFAGSEYDASFANSPQVDDHFNETSPPRGYKYRFGSARTSVENSGTRTGELAGAISGGIGGSTAAPVTLRGPLLADTDPADLDTVNYITSSYAEFFQDSLLAADPLHRLERLERLGQLGQDSDGPEEYVYTTSSEDEGDGEEEEEDGRSEDSQDNDLNQTIDSLEQEEPTKSSSRSSPTRCKTHTSNPSNPSNPANTSNTSASSSPARRPHESRRETRMPSTYVPYLDAAIPEGSMTLPEALLELEHLRRTNHALVESLSEENHRRSELEDKLGTAQDDLLEVRTQCDVQLDSYRLEIKQLKAQMRTICDNQSLTDVFATFEDNVARLVRENEALRQANLQLETKELDSLLRTGVNGASSDVNAFANHTADANGESFRLQTAKKENLRLVSKLKKAGIEREALRSAFEEVKAKERQFVVNTKIANDCARRLRITHQELLRAKKELENEQAGRALAERDLHLIREDTAGLRVSEAVLKEERARNLSELAMLRERVREVDHERRRLSQLHRFVEKHFDPTHPVPQHNQPAQQAQQSPPRRGGHQSASHAVPPPPPSAVPSILRAAPLSTLSSQPYRQRIVAALSQHSREAVTGSVPPYSMPSAVPYASRHSDEQKGSYEETDAGHSQGGARYAEGQAGVSDAQYFRLEEADGIEPALEVSLTAMHESLIATTPQLLPLFRRLTTDIHTERTKALQKWSQLLNQLGAAQYDRPIASPATAGHASAAPTSTKDTNAAYLNMLKLRGLGNGNSYVTQHEGKVSQNGAKKPTKSVRF